MQWQLQFTWSVAFIAVAVERCVALQFVYSVQQDSCDQTCADLGLDNLVGNPIAVGDPHLRNLRGERFDIMREGVSTFLVYPIQNEWKQAQETQLRVDASVEHPGNESMCKGFFILRLWIKGSLIGDEPIEISTSGNNLKTSDALKIKIGNQTVQSPEELAACNLNGKYKTWFSDDRPHMAKTHLHNRIKFATLKIHLVGVGLSMEINWFTGRKQANRLDFKAHHLGKLGGEWGGILGADDHTWVATLDPRCRQQQKHESQFQQLLDVSHHVPWEAKAFLD